MALTTPIDRKQSTKCLGSPTNRSSRNTSSSAASHIQLSSSYNRHQHSTVELSKKDDSILNMSGVIERKLAMKMDTIEKESQTHLKSREREERALKELCRDLRKHVGMQSSSDHKKHQSSRERLNLPSIFGDNQMTVQRRSLSASNSPETSRRYTSYPFETEPRKPSWLNDERGRCDSDVREHTSSTETNRAALVDSKRKRNLERNHSIGIPLSRTPSITVEQCSEDPRQQKRSIPVWELGLIPTRRARTQEELIKADRASRLAGKQHKSDSNLLKSSHRGALEDARFERLESILVPCGKSLPKPIIDRSPSDNSHLRACECIAEDYSEDIRMVRSAPSSPRRGKRQYVLSKTSVGNIGLMPSPPPPQIGQRSAPTSPLNRPKIVIGRTRLDDSISAERRNRDKTDIESFDFTRLAPRPIAVMSPPPTYESDREESFDFTPLDQDSVAKTSPLEAKSDSGHFDSNRITPGRVVIMSPPPKREFEL